MTRFESDMNQQAFMGPIQVCCGGTVATVTLQCPKGVGKALSSLEYIGERM